MHNCHVNIHDLEQEFANQAIGRRIRHFAETASTNSLAMSELKAGQTNHGDIFVADRQSAGRGQSGRVWQSESNDGLWMSVVLMDKDPIQPLSFLPCLAVHDYLNQELRLDAHLKWPNDILVGSRKIAGVLIESTTVANQAHAPAWILGIGLNLERREFSDELRDRATSVALEMGPCPAQLSALRGVLQHLNRWIESARDLTDPWMERSRMPGRTLAFDRQGQTFRATVKGLTAEGYLQLEHEDGRIETIVSSGDINFPLDY